MMKPGIKFMAGWFGYRRRTSEEIALSIIAEIKSAFSNRNGASLKEKKLKFMNVQ